MKFVYKVLHIVGFLVTYCGLDWQTLFFVRWSFCGRSCIHSSVMQRYLITSEGSSLIAGLRNVVSRVQVMRLCLFFSLQSGSEKSFSAPIKTNDFWNCNCLVNKFLADLFPTRYQNIFQMLHISNMLYNVNWIVKNINSLSLVHPVAFGTLTLGWVSGKASSDL